MEKNQSEGTKRRSMDGHSAAPGPSEQRGLPQRPSTEHHLQPTRPDHSPKPPPYLEPPTSASTRIDHYGGGTHTGCKSTHLLCRPTLACSGDTAENKSPAATQCDPPTSPSGAAGHFRTSSRPGPPVVPVGRKHDFRRLHPVPAYLPATGPLQGPRYPPSSPPSPVPIHLRPIREGDLRRGQHQHEFHRQKDHGGKRSVDKGKLT